MVTPSVKSTNDNQQRHTIIKPERLIDRINNFESRKRCLTAQKASQRVSQSTISEQPKTKQEAPTKGTEQSSDNKDYVDMLNVVQLRKSPDYDQESKENESFTTDPELSQTNINLVNQKFFSEMHRQPRRHQSQSQSRYPSNSKERQRKMSVDKDQIY